MKPVRSLGIGLVLLALIGAGAVAHHKLLRWKKFATVEPGVLYRSGQLRDWQLRQAISRYGIKTVFSFTYTDYTREAALCAEMGVRHHFCYLPGDGVGPDEPYLRFLEIARNPECQPLLVHCSAGVQRTGGAVALYRMVYHQWEFEAAIDEMIAMGNDGKREQIEQLRRLSTVVITPHASALAALPNNQARENGDSDQTTR